MSLLQSGVIGILAFIFILGAAVTLHEFGHFIVAKLLKIRVETFSFGFGPRLFGKKKGHTDYRVSLIPLGGYVKLGGDESNAPIEGEGASDIPASERFDLRPRWQRVLVAIAGPVMNVLTAISIPFLGAMIYGVQIAPPPVVRHIVPGGAAETAGLQAGDRIVAFNGTEHPRWRRISDDALLSPGEPIPLVVDRAGQQVPLTIKPTSRTDQGETFGTLDFLPDYGNLPIIVGSVEEGTPASEAGLKAGDRILAVNGEPVRSSEQVSQFVRDHPKQPITLHVSRGGQELDVTATARRIKAEETRDRLGFGPEEDVPYQRIGLIGSLVTAVDDNVEYLRVTGKAMGQLFAGKRSVRNTISGPIGIYRVASTSAIRFGWAGIFGTLGFLSLNLGIFNLLPIPVLDGGAIFLLLIEGGLAKVGMTISRTVRERIQQVGFVVVLLLMVFVITNDLLKQASIFRGGGDSPPAASPAPASSPAR
jgi:regulator of sigma E protease